ncbi:MULTISPECIES: biopolymer transporter ExbD [unclassified Ruegeria]|uniref:ExbD/TolR family protein n=1 Tax=unclassified Ruegeria TaxID=2625375 RepID=UPI0014878C77|nr:MULTISPECIES: biopolymer transporter ExbD [unclassified Ruegeria]
MTNELTLHRRKPTRPLISLVPMIDVLLILLVFFMVTSTYLNLDMIPALAQSDRPAPAQEVSGEANASALLIRIGADGAPYHQGKPMTLSELDTLLAVRLGDDPSTQVIILPTGGAALQSLVSVMDSVTLAGVVNMRVVRLEASP